MVFRAVQKVSQGNIGCIFGLRRLTHGIALPTPVSSVFEPVTSPPLLLPESDTDFSSQLPGSFFNSGSMELMAVPKRKVSRHKRGIRNGPKALKPTPVIIRCNSCGRVKLPHFYCCGGRRDEPGERSDAVN